MLRATSLLKRQFKPLKFYTRHLNTEQNFENYLRNLPSTRYSKLYNGVRVATEEKECITACIGLFIDGGSRYESSMENGVAHFFEHVAFKGTNRRDRQLLERVMADLGAKFRCHVSRELVVYYVECLSKDVPLATDILVDCVFNNALETDVIEAQKSVVYAEMLEHDKDPGAVVVDYLHATAFQGTPLAQTVMGPSANLYNFKATNICRYLSKCFDPCRTVLAAAGNIKHEQMMSLAGCHMGKLDPLKSLDVEAYRYTGSEVNYRDDSMPTAHVMVAVEGPCFAGDDEFVMEVAKFILGGWDRSQPGGVMHPVRIAREASTNGYCDSYHAFNITYKDCGLFGVHFVSDVMNIDNMMLVIQDEFLYLCLCVTESEVERAKNFLKAKLLTQMDTPVGTCMDVGRWTLYNGCRPSLRTQLSGLESITVADVRATCYRYLYDKCPVVSAIGPTEGLMEYPRTRASMWWLRN